MPNFFKQGDVLILPAGGTATLTEAISDALDMLSMTRCPYFRHEEKCDRGCLHEPACITDAPIEGWVEGAIAALERALPEDQAAPRQTEA